MTPRPTGAQTAAQPVPGALRLELARLEARHLLQLALLALWLLVARTAVRLWQGFFRARPRTGLAELDPHLLRDIGLDPTVRRSALRKWPWPL